MTKDLLDKDTCDRVMQDMEICLDDWSQRLDTKVAVITLTRFVILTALSFHMIRRCSQTNIINRLR